jgi:WD40 repeat protein
MSRVAALDPDYTAQVVDLATGQATALGRCEAVRAIDESSRYAAVDGQMLCTDFDLAAPLPGPAVPSRIADLRTGDTVLDLGEAVVFGAAFGPTGDGGVPRIVAVIDGLTSTITVYDLTTGTQVGTYTPEDAFALNLAISSDGSRLAVTLTNGQLAVLDLARLARTDDSADAVTWTVNAHSGSVQAVAISASEWIATASSAGNVRVWSSDGELFADLAISLDDPPSLAFAPATDTLFYEDGDGVFRRFVVDPDENVRLAKSLISRDLTPDECSRYFAGEECPTFDE